MYCPICGKETEDDKEQFCKYCKGDLRENATDGESPIILCPNCKKEIDVKNGEVSFCKNCGVNLTKENIEKETTIISCPFCNKEIDIGNGEIKFCEYCGSNIIGADKDKILPKYCPNCGKKMDETDDELEFCKYCGEKLGKTFTKIDSKKRPTSVSIIGWLIIVSCVLAGVAIIGGNTTITYGSAGYAKILIFELIFELILAIGILKGSNWCRLALLILQPISLVIQWLVVKKFQPEDVLSIVVIIIITIILTRPNAVRFFKANQKIN